MKTLELKSIYMFCRSCSSRHTEHSKIEFAIIGFFYDFLWILQVTGSKGKTRRIYFYSSPWENQFSTRVLERFQSSQGYPSGRTWTTNGTGVPRCSPETDWWHRWGRSGLRRWPAARQWWHNRHGSDSGAMQARLGHHVLMEARVGAREKFTVAGWLWAWAEQQDHRRRQWRVAAGGRVARAHDEMKQGVL
jgi:hypothetical protein